LGLTLIHGVPVVKPTRSLLLQLCDWNDKMALCHLIVLVTLQVTQEAAQIWKNGEVVHISGLVTPSAAIATTKRWQPSGPF